MTEKLQDITNSKNEKFQTNKIGDPNHPNCVNCQFRTALLFNYAIVGSEQKISKKSRTENFCNKKHMIIKKINANSCPFKSYEIKTIKVKSK